MFDLDDLIPTAAPRKSVKGKWCAIRFSPTPYTGEQLNIGIAFKPDRERIQTRMLSSAAGFKALYGSNGVENFNFLLAVVAQSMQSSQRFESPSPHISFGPLLSIQGENVQSIMDSLYEATVILRVPEELPSRANRTMNTQDLRKKLIRNLKTYHAAQADNFLHEQQVIAYIDSRPLLLDLPLWQSGDLASGRVFGSIVSAKCIEEVYRQHDLDRAFRNIDTAQRFIAKDGRGAVFILRPPSNDSGFPVRDIDNDIDAIVWPLSKAGIHIDVEDRIETLQKRVAQFIAA